MPPAAPVPLAAIACGLPAPLLATLIAALRLPSADGVNVSANEHDAPALTTAQFDALTANSAALLLVIDDTVTAALPVLLSVIVCAALAVPTTWLPNGAAAGSDSCPVPGGGVLVMPVPDSGIDTAPPSAYVIVSVVLSAPAAAGE